MDQDISNLVYSLTKPIVWNGFDQENTVTTMRRSSGNVFKDLGFPAKLAENLRIRCELMDEIVAVIEQRGLTQAAAAKVFGVTHPRVSDLVRGKIDLFAIDALIGMLAKAGCRVNMRISRAAS